MGSSRQPVERLVSDCPFTVFDQTRTVVSDRVAANMQANFQGGGGTNGAAYTTWLANVIAALPGVTSTVNQPVVTVNTANGQVTVVVKWLLPSEPAGTTAHNYTIMAQIK